MPLRGQHRCCSVRLPSMSLTRARQGCFEVHVPHVVLEGVQSLTPFMVSALPHLAGYSRSPQLCRVHCILGAVMTCPASHQLSVPPELHQASLSASGERTAASPGCRAPSGGVGGAGLTASGAQPDSTCNQPPRGCSRPTTRQSLRPARCAMQPLPTCCATLGSSATPMGSRRLLLRFHARGQQPSAAAAAFCAKTCPPQQ